MKKLLLIGLLAVFFLAGCATNRHALTGAAVGGIAGTVICRGNPNCVWLGAVLGAAIGNEADQTRLDREREEYWKKRAEMQREVSENAIRVIEVNEDTEVIFVNEEGKIQKY